MNNYNHNILIIFNNLKKLKVLIKMPKIKYKIIKFNKFIYFYLINIKKIKKININNFYYIRSVILFNLNLFAIYF